MSRILLVEDSHNLNKALCLRLTHAGYEVAGVHTVAAALDRAPALQPHLAILDINLPDGDGLELADRLTAIVPDLLLLFATANRDPALRRQVTRAGAFALLLKPFDAAELLETVGRALDAGLPVPSSRSASA